MTTSQKQFSSECLQLSEPSVRKCPTKFIGKHLYQSLFLIKTLAFIYSAIWLKKRVRHRCFLVNGFAKSLTTPISKNNPV